MKFSVIIPSYNRSRQLMLTLAALEKQTYPMDHFEVIIFNDGSTDDTVPSLESYHPPYRIQVLNSNATMGRSAARNAGVAVSAEDYLVFCDPDFLVTPDFLEVHARYLAVDNNRIVSGVPNLWRSVFTHLHPDFSEQEKLLAARVLLPHGLWNEQYMIATDLIEFVTPEDIRNQTDVLPKVIADWDVIDSIKVQFAQTDVAPWLLCVTRCLSMSKQVFQSVGGFNENFIKYGLEDWELGYRLHQRGYKFASISEVIGYHQEHPSAPRLEDENSDNIRLAFQQHGFQDPEFSLFSLCSPADRVQMYKNVLRILQAWKGSKHAAYRHTARGITRACSRCARELFKQPDSPEHRRLKLSLLESFMTADAVYMENTPDKDQRIKAILDEVLRALNLQTRRSMRTIRRIGRKRTKAVGKRRRTAVGRRRTMTVGQKRTTKLAKPLWRRITRIKRSRAIRRRLPRPRIGAIKRIRLSKRNSTIARVTRSGSIGSVWSSRYIRRPD
ncbi:glycosyltransferase family 2 protein [Cohnella lupini]|uniref:GT2 family glycosyltransferase n=1 Tax=Cohnella lupini TaxID=1294267 RepID=A0A3D9I9X6_9BACL|nr:glycosyltransferase family 2 protein [Cohnella lupini]RED58584.1 GT2 family glycosyltransferase [Cohnella lupini]